MSDASQIEKLLRELVRQELSRLLGVELDTVDDDAELRERVAVRAAALRKARVAQK